MTQDYTVFKASGTFFEIENRYSLIRPIGHGAYGVVISANDSNTNSKVAIKKISRAFDDPVDAKRILREIKLMKLFSHENVIRVLDLTPPPPTTEEFDDIYIVQDLMETDLHRIIYSKQPLTISHIQYFIYQVLRGLKYIHSANVLHRDLKPSNLLLNSNCDLKICDFGLARVAEEAGDQTEYVVTRWYRAPEIMLACQHYTYAIDIWSVGCIFAELLGRRAMFPGDDYMAQLRLICDRLGRPSEQDLDFVSSERAKKFMLGLPDSQPEPLEKLFPNHSDEDLAIDLLKKMLTFRPGDRITVEEALAHPFMDTLHNPMDEPEADFSVHFDFEDEELSRERIQELIWEEIRELHPSIPLQYPGSGVRRNRSTNNFASFTAAVKSSNSNTNSNITSSDDIHNNIIYSSTNENDNLNNSLYNRLNNSNSSNNGNSNGNIYSTHGEAVADTDTERIRRDAKLEKMMGRDRSSSNDSSERDWRDADSRDGRTRRTSKNSRDMSMKSEGGPESDGSTDSYSYGHRSSVQEEQKLTRKRSISPAQHKE